MLFCETDLRAQKTRQNEGAGIISNNQTEAPMNSKTPVAPANLLRRRWKQTERGVYSPTGDNTELNAMQTSLLFTSISYLPEHFSPRLLLTDCSRSIFHMPCE